MPPPAPRGLRPSPTAFSEAPTPSSGVMHPSPTRRPTPTRLPASDRTRQTPPADREPICRSAHRPFVRRRLEHDPALFDHLANCFRADPDEIDRRTIDDDGVHLLADLEAADARVAVDRI